jgi:hypothetical protein
MHVLTGIISFKICYKWKPEFRFNLLVENNVAEGETFKARKFVTGYTLKIHKEIWERNKATAEKYYNAKYKDKFYRIGD